ncbi:hypothetical protein [Aeromonas enterica]
MPLATTPNWGGIFQPGSTWLTICQAVCGVLHMAGPLHPEQARILLEILRHELVKAALPAQAEARLDPWHYLTDHAYGQVVLSSAGRNIQRQTPNRTAQTLIKNTLTHWRKNHD